MSLRKPLIILSMFMVVALGVTFLVYNTLRREVSGATTPFAAVFTDAYGLNEGDDVRMAGVRVGRVQSVELDGDKAKVSFIVQSDQRLYGNTYASVLYENIIGQRHLALSLGETGSTDQLPANSVIPVERTEPSFDVGTMLNGFEPMFTLLDPKQANNLTQGLIRSFGGDRSSLTALVDQTTEFTETLAGRDKALGDAITSLSKVTSSLAEQSDNLDHTLEQTSQVVEEFDARRPELKSSIGSLAQVTRGLSAVADEVYPSFNELVNRQPGFAAHMVSIEPQVAFAGLNLPLLLKGLARATGEGSYANAYACDVNATGFFPGLNDVTTYIVNAATPGNAHPRVNQNLAWHTPKCRNMSNG
ncbi:putative MCE family protein [Mycolicibacterium cyprinidarum]|uniref:MCE family protein n=1 Tax=Mycolicibacterium cyprinidarum TaxID=2860311 RepID=A0ABQ4V8I6_9MYCO|nr:putative MCE family protein [Mycolicibacterium sp. NGTWSNA01]GJF19248.1 putative MCE family protein [Mycolicibacterium sp. NGTWS0302]GJF19646.1 putative MCE family protein [Mycolicibacterium sp. NGTWS1803]